MLISSIKFLTWSQYILMGVCVLIAVGFYSLMERKILSLIHYRIGPNKVSLKGILQPIADAMKLISKDDRPVRWSNYILFYFSPLFLLSISLSVWILFPFKLGCSMPLSFISLMIFMGMGIYGLIFSGWASNSKYALIGSLRCVAQSLSYEVVLSFVLITVIFIYKTFLLSDIWNWNMTCLSFMLPQLFLIFTYAILAEMNRTPFDLAEGESELVSGYSVEYGGVMYTILFLSENLSIFTASFLMVFFFFPTQPLVLPLQWAFFSMIISVIRGVFPRIRYDKLMLMCWNLLLPMVMLTFNFSVVMLSFLGS